jgi:hypothetical protein
MYGEGQSSIGGVQFDMYPGLAEILRTGRFECYASAGGMLSWFHSLLSDIASNISSILLGETSMSSTDEVWTAGDEGFSEFMLTSLKHLTSLKEVVLWMPHHGFDDYPLVAPVEMCIFLEDGSLDTVRFLFDGHLDNYDDHQLIGALLRKEQPDIDAIEVMYGSNAEARRIWDRETARIIALGLRFSAHVEYPDKDDGRDTRGDEEERKPWSQNTVVTFRRWNEVDKGSIQVQDAI